MVKLGKALYYRHAKRLFDGDLYVRHVDILRRDVTPAKVEAMLRFAPDLAQPERSKSH